MLQVGKTILVKAKIMIWLFTKKNTISLMKKRCMISPARSLTAVLSTWTLQNKKVLKESQKYFLLFKMKLFPKKHIHFKQQFTIASQLNIRQMYWILNLLRNMQDSIVLSVLTNNSYRINKWRGQHCITELH